jgi:hypothetical protein
MTKAAIGTVPTIGAAIGRAVGDERGAQWGRAAGGALGGGLGGWFDVELEGLSPEDTEFEVSRRFVRFACAAARNLLRQMARSQQGQVVARSPSAAAKAAVITAARKHAPGITRIVATTGRTPAISAGVGPAQASGQWVRRGNTVVLFGI